MSLRTSITRRDIKQRGRDGNIVTLPRYLLNYKDPNSGKRIIRRFNRRMDAEEAQAMLIKGQDTLAPQKDIRGLTIGEAAQAWLDAKKKTISPECHRAYRQMVADYILGPVFPVKPSEKARIRSTKKIPAGIKPVSMIGAGRVINTIGTADIRIWYSRVLEVGSPYIAKIAKKYLASIFRQVEEDYDIHLARIPQRLGPGYRRRPRQLLNEQQVKVLLEEAQQDMKWGPYYAFLILTGVRPSEMLGLLWEDVNLDRGAVRVVRAQNDDGSLKDFPKTKAGIREIPLTPTLQKILVDWQSRCPRRRDGSLYRVFPAQGKPGARGRQAKNAEISLSLHNFRMRVWYPLLHRLGLPKISLYALRHMAISFLQAQGVEVGLVSKIAGHASPQITLGYYTHGVRDASQVMNRLDDAYLVGGKHVATATQVQISANPYETGIEGA